MKPSDAVREAERELASAAVPEARTDAEILVAHVLGLARSEVHAGARELDGAQVARLRALVERRRSREPLQHILGEWGFRRLSLRVDPRALVPRPETEVTVDRALARIEGLAEPLVFDVGTGSGAIALAILDEHPGATVVAVDVSEDALALARENAERTGYDNRLELIACELRGGDATSNTVLLGRFGRLFDLVVSNPPYIRHDDVGSLMPEVRDHDPRGAIVESGLTQAVVHAARHLLRPRGWLVVECGDAQDEALAELFASLGYFEVTITPDLAGIGRVVEGRSRGSGGGVVGDSFT